MKAPHKFVSRRSVLAASALGVSGAAAAAPSTATPVPPASAEFAGRALAEQARLAEDVTFVRLGGLRSAGDGGAALYRKVPSNPPHLAKFRSRDGAWWELAEQPYALGMFDTGGDYSYALHVAEGFFASGRSGELSLPGADIRVPRTIYFPAGISLSGVPWKTRILPGKNAVYDDNVMFRLNVDSSGKWILGYLGPRAGTVRDLRLWNDLDIDIRGFEVGGGYKFSRVSAENFCQLAKANRDYVDQLTYEECLLFWKEAPREWPEDHRSGFQSGALGDGLRIDGCHSVPFAGASRTGGADYKSIALSMCRGGVIANQINGLIHLRLSSAVTVIGGHFELGGLQLSESSAAVRSSAFFNRALLGRSPIDVLPSDDNSCFTLSLDDVSFHVLEDFGGLPTAADVRLAPNYRLSVKDSFRRFGRNGHLGMQGVFGMSVADGKGIPLPEWSSKSAACSMAGTVDIDGRVSTEVVISTSRAGALEARSTKRAAPFAMETGSYSYAYQVLYDTARLLGHDMDAREVSLALTRDGSGAMLKASRLAGVTLRWYRGTETGAYKWFADVPVVAPGAMYDFGGHVSGFPWIARSPGPVDTLAIPDFYGTVRWPGDLIDASFPAAAATLVPTAGSWKTGDMIRFANIPIEGSSRVAGLRRLTTGDGNVIGVDWFQEKLNA